MCLERRREYVGTRVTPTGHRGNALCSSTQYDDSVRYLPYQILCARVAKVKFGHGWKMAHCTASCIEAASHSWAMTLQRHNMHMHRGRLPMPGNMLFHVTQKTDGMVCIRACDAAGGFSQPGPLDAPASGAASALVNLNLHALSSIKA